MKSSNEILKKRGFINPLDLSLYQHLNMEQLYQLLSSKKAHERTIAIHYLFQSVDPDDLRFVLYLLEQLKKETALYTKLEICRCLEKGNANTCRKMIKLLGTIGKNQYQILPQKVSKKKSYPLPRDVIARTLGRINPKYAEALFEELNTINLAQLSELLDAIGLLVFYHSKLNTFVHFEQIKKVIENHQQHHLIVWKGIICLSAFPSVSCETYCHLLKQKITEPFLQSEIDRTLTFITKNSI